jgi:putative spermidine/putrescine transport system substrate-binding protein/spermidine/putrescine transport system substrate-binding protein
MSRPSGVSTQTIARRSLPVVFLLLLARTAIAGGDLNILSWEGYADASFVKPFEKATGCGVSATYVGSNDEFVAKIIAGGGTYDLITPSNDTTMRLIDAGVVEPISPARVPNMKDFFPIFASPSWITKNGALYGVPYGWGIVRLLLDADSGLAKPDSLGYLWQPQLRGKVAIWDDIEAIYMASRYLGYKNTYDLSDEQLQKVKATLIALKPNIRKYWATTGEMGTLLQSHEVLAGNAWEPTLVSLRKAGRHIIDVVPKEGRSAYSDSWMVVRGAGSNACVYQWLNWVSSPKAQALAHAVTGFGYSNAKMPAELAPIDRQRYEELGMTDPNVIKTLDWWQLVKRRGKYLEIWNQVKAQ